MEAYQTLLKQAKSEVDKASDLASLDKVRVAYLGKKGELTQQLKNLKNLDQEARIAAGKVINEIKATLVDELAARKAELAQQAVAAQLAKEQVDVTLPAKGVEEGRLHPITLTMEKICSLFRQCGFNIAYGPEVDTEFYNFEALNIPSHHPARAMHDTFYFGDGYLLRTHTSPVQIRSMEKSAPPFRLIAPGRVYRCDSDVTHTPMFHQVEGLVIDNTANLSHLKELLTNFFSEFFGAPVKTRFRPSYFPFTEPSAEVDISCTHCSGEGCRSCKMTGWLEVLGCGMVHPNVLKAVNIDSNKYQGYAFGLGIDRLAMLYYGIDDLRIMFENDLAFLQQF